MAAPKHVFTFKQEFLPFSLIFTRTNATVPGSRILSVQKSLAGRFNSDAFLSIQAVFLLQVPSFLIMQVRRMNEATMLLKKQLPSVKKLLRRKTIEREVMTMN